MTKQKLFIRAGKRNIKEESHSMLWGFTNNRSDLFQHVIQVMLILLNLVDTICVLRLFNENFFYEMHFSFNFLK